MNRNGSHIICEFNDCNKKRICSSDLIANIFQNFATKTNCKIFNISFSNSSSGEVTGFVSMEDSQFSLHSFPENAYVVIDAYLWGNNSLSENLMHELTSFFESANQNIRQFESNLLNTESKSENDKPNGEKIAGKIGSHLKIIHKGNLFLVEEGDENEKHQFRASSWLYKKSSEYQKIEIIRNPLYGKMLFLDGVSQSGALDEYVYHEALIHPGLLAHSSPRSVLVLGGGEGASIREVLRHKSVQKVVMVDIDGQLVESCKEHLPEWSRGAYKDKRVQVVIDDGKSWVEQCDTKFDAIVMDLTDYIDEGSSLDLYTSDFLKLIKKRLNVGGLLIIQAGELSLAEHRGHKLMRDILSPLFSRLYSYLQFVPTFHSEWSYVIATDSFLEIDQQPAEIDRKIFSRISGELKFYDGESHQKIFTISKDLRKLLSIDKNVSTILNKSLNDEDSIVNKEIYVSQGSA